MCFRTCSEVNQVLPDSARRRRKTWNVAEVMRFHPVFTKHHVGALASAFQATVVYIIVALCQLPPSQACGQK